MTDKLLTQQQLADELEVSLRTLERWRNKALARRPSGSAVPPATAAPTSTPGWNDNDAPTADKVGADEPAWRARHGRRTAMPGQHAWRGSVGRVGSELVVLEDQA
jgi:hypothetical protein